MKRIMGILAILLLCCGVSYAAGTATLTVEYVSGGPGGIPDAAELKWVCAGNATGYLTSPTVTTTETTRIILRKIFESARRIERVIIDPTGGGGTAPANLYDIEVRVNSLIANDLLGGLGDNCGNTTIKMDSPLTETNNYPMYLRETPVVYGVNLGITRTFAIHMLVR